MSESGMRSPVGFAEVPDFHVEVARQMDPTLVGRSVVVGGDPTKRGKVVAASADLRMQGIVEGMGVAEALDRAPGAVWVRTDIRRAREVSGSLRAAVREEVDAVEIDGLAGFYMRAPRTESEAVELASRLETKVLERTGLPLRIGIAPVRFAARLAAEDVGRSGHNIIGETAFDAYLLRLPLERLPGVGPKAAARLTQLGAVDMRGLRNLGLERLEVLLGNRGRTLWLLACGDDSKPLRVKRHPNTLSREETLAEPTLVTRELAESLTGLASDLEAALSRDGLSATRIALRLTGADERTVTRSCTLETPAVAASALALAAHRLLERVELWERPIRRIALVLKGLDLQGAQDRQLDLF
jgi:DNA polymerase-4